MHAFAYSLADDDDYWSCRKCVLLTNGLSQCFGVHGAPLRGPGVGFN